MSSGDIFNHLKFKFLKHNLDVSAYCFTHEELHEKVKQLVLSKKVDGLIVNRRQFDGNIKKFLYKQNVPFILLNQANLHNTTDN